MNLDNFYKKTIKFFLKWLAKFYLVKNKPYIIVISGTTNRYWVREEIAGILRERNFLVRTNKKNFNAEIGLPLSILGLSSGEKKISKWAEILWQAVKINTKEYAGKEYLILEMAIDRPEDMDYLTGIVKPHTVILTTITMIYRENFENLDEIANEYAKLIKTIPWNGLLILNGDDKRIKKLSAFFDGKIIYCGFEEDAHFRTFDIKKVLDGQEFKVEIKRKEKEIRDFKIRTFGKHHIYAALVREAIADNFTTPAKEFFAKISKDLLDVSGE
ncbi:MAG: Mur ligase family protein [Patescibacteria group bacterium]|nr:Mur ligase family protein [Patescibacteria group bacterium]